ncbi:MAG: PAS domain S-box protein [Chloroflexi bacterium]|nr:PAS domain S-box protein [Chloroflexota bacterium]
MNKPTDVLALRQMTAGLDAQEASQPQTERSTLGEHEEWLRGTFAQSPIAIELFDSHGNLLGFNQECMNMFGFTDSSEILAAPILSDPRLPAAMREKLSAGEAVKFEGFFDFDKAKQQGMIKSTKSGIIHLDVQIAPLRQPGSLIGYLLQVQDITKRKAAEDALRAREEWFRNIFAQSPISIVLYDSQGNWVSLNQASMDMFGFTDFSEAMAPPLFSDQRLPKAVREKLRAGEAVRFEGFLDFDRAKLLGMIKTTKSGLIHLDMQVTPITETGSLTGYLFQVQDITKRKQAENALRELSRRLVEVQETERRHIARELHDEIGQALTGLKLLIDTLHRLPPERIEGSLREAQALIDEMMTRAHDLSLDLRPSMLDDLGLLSALLWHIRRYTDVTGVRVAFKHRGLRQRFAPELETAVYRIVQEALTNIARHAGVKAATLQVSADPHRLSVRIEDKGRGFNWEGMTTTLGSTGLTGMRERAIALGGDLAIDSSPGRGTRLTAAFPVTEPREASPQP